MAVKVVSHAHPESAVAFTLGLAENTYEGTQSLFDDLSPEWRKLCDSGPVLDPFCRPEVARAYLDAYQPQAQLLIITARTFDQMKGILPLIRGGARRYFPFRTLSTAGERRPTRWGSALVIAPDVDAKAVAQAMWDKLKKQKHWDTLELWNVPEGSPLESLVESARTDNYPTVTVRMPLRPFMPIKASVEGRTLEILPENKRLRTKLRQIQRELGVPSHRLLLTRHNSLDSDALQRFMALEASGWKGEEQSAITSREDDRRFWSGLADAGARFGYFTLYELELDGTTVAAHYGLTYREQYFAPKIAYDEKFARYSPGHLIVQLILEDCAKRGISQYEIGGNFDDWKKKWTSTGHQIRTYYIFRRNLVSLLHKAQLRTRNILKKANP